MMNRAERSTRNEDIQIAIVGAGMGGLAAALALARRGFSHIDVYETASNLGFVGAGIQLAPNMARILDRLGCWEAVKREAVELRETSIRQGDTDTELGHVDLLYIEKEFRYPHMVGHRSSLAGALYNACLQQNSIKFHFSTSVRAVNVSSARPCFTATPRQKEAYTIEVDVILGADGVKSRTRDALLQELNVDMQVTDTGQAAYRIMLEREDIKHDPELLLLVNSSKVTRWIGEKRHIIAYPVSSNSIYNISTAQPDTHFAAAPSATYTTKGSKTDMLNTFSDFCPLVQRMLGLVPDGEICEWKLRVHDPLPTWVCGSVALLGDACHPTLPHLAQGAAQAIEDAAVVAICLSKCPAQDPHSIHKALKAYEMLRKNRAETLVSLAAASGRALHLGDGEAKTERDRLFAALKTGQGAVPDKWADQEVQRMIYGHDCMSIAEESFDTLYESL